MAQNSHSNFISKDFNRVFFLNVILGEPRYSLKSLVDACISERLFFIMIHQKHSAVDVVEDGFVLIIRLFILACHIKWEPPFNYSSVKYTLKKQENTLKRHALHPKGLTLSATDTFLGSALTRPKKQVLRYNHPYRPQGNPLCPLSRPSLSWRQWESLCPVPVSSPLPEIHPRPA